MVGFGRDTGCLVEIDDVMEGKEVGIFVEICSGARSTLGTSLKMETLDKGPWLMLFGEGGWIVFVIVLVIEGWREFGSFNGMVL